MEQKYNILLQKIIEKINTVHGTQPFYLELSYIES
jgi:hypothetical protein